jgi:hypothetical protein
MVFGGLEQPRGPDDLAPEPADLKLFARIEGLVGEEVALLTIPAHERSQHQHDRLRAITAELDRVWEKLRERAERHGHREGAPESS